MAKLGQLSPDTVVLGGAWERYIESGVTPGDIINTVSETVRWLKNKGARRIVIFGPGPVWTTSLSVDLFRFMARNRSKRIPERLGTVSGQLWLLDSAMSTLATAGNVQYVSVLNFFCDKGGCLTVGDRTMPRPDLLYRDRDHLTVSGSKLLVAHSKPQLFGETR